MQNIPRAILFTAALLASAQLLAAEADSPTTNVRAQHATTEPDDCWPPAADFSTGLTRLLPRASSTPDSSGIDRDAGNAATCARPLGLQKNQQENGGSLKPDHFLTAAPADTRMSWPRPRSFLESSPGPATPGLHF